MAWDKGFNFRSTSGYVLDGINETYVCGETIPTTRNGVTFQFSSAMGFNLNRNATVDRRLAGCSSVANNRPTVDFIVTLPAPGNYALSLALGDMNYGQVSRVVIKDDTLTLATIGKTTTANGSFLDATGTALTAVNWPTSQTQIVKAFSSTILRISLGANDGTSFSTAIAHLRVTQVEPSETVDPIPALINNPVTL